MGKQKHRPRRGERGTGKRGSPAGSQRVCCGLHGACFLLHHPHDTSGTPAFPTRVFTSMGSWWGNRDRGVGRAGISEPEWGHVPGTCKNLDGPHMQPGWRAALKALRPSLASAAPSAVSRTWRALPLQGHALPDGSAWLRHPPPHPILNRGTALSAGARSSKDQAGPLAPQVPSPMAACGTSNDHESDAEKRDQGPLQPSEAPPAPAPGAEPRLPGTESVTAPKAHSNFRAKTPWKPPR